MIYNLKWQCKVDWLTLFQTLFYRTLLHLSFQSSNAQTVQRLFHPNPSTYFNLPEPCSKYIPSRRSRNWCLYDLGASGLSKAWRKIKVENISWYVDLWRLLGKCSERGLMTVRESGRMLNHISWGLVMYVKTDVFPQFSSPSLAPVCGTNSPKTDVISA